MNNQSKLSGYVLSCKGTPITSLNFMPSADNSYMGVYAKYGNSLNWTPLGIELPFLPTLQQVRDANRNISLNAGSYENAHFYLRSAEGNNVTTAFYTNAAGGAIQSGDTDSYVPLNLQPLGGQLTYGGKEVATTDKVIQNQNVSAQVANAWINGNMGIKGYNSAYSLYVNGNAILGTIPASTIFGAAPFTLSNSQSGAAKTQLNLINGGGGRNSGSAIDFYTYTDAGNGKPGVRVASVDNGTYSGNFIISTKGNYSTADLFERFKIYGTGGVQISSLAGSGTRIVMADATGNLSAAIIGSAGQLLRKNATNTGYEFFTPNYLTSVPSLQQVTAAGGTTTVTTNLRGGTWVGAVDELYIDTNGCISPQWTAKRTVGLYGNYDSTKIGHIWSIGTAYKIADDGSTFGGNGGNGLYGIAYVYQSHALAPMSDGGHQYVFADNGTPNAGVSSTDGRFWGRHYAGSGNRIMYTDAKGQLFASSIDVDRIITAETDPVYTAEASSIIKARRNFVGNGSGIDLNAVTGSEHGFAYNNGTISSGIQGAYLSFGQVYYNDGYQAQFLVDYLSDSFKFRSRNGNDGTWLGWKEVISSSNISNYSILNQNASSQAANGWISGHFTADGSINAGSMSTMAGRLNSASGIAVDGYINNNAPSYTTFRFGNISNNIFGYLDSGGGGLTNKSPYTDGAMVYLAGSSASATINNYINGINQFIVSNSGAKLGSSSARYAMSDNSHVSGNNDAWTFLTNGGAALPIKTGSHVISDSYSDTAPANGLFVKGGIQLSKATNPSGISYYAPSFKAWTTYMAQAGTTNNGVNGNITAPAGVLVKTWGLRSFIENATDYGWTWESGLAADNPNIIAELSSKTGDFRVAGYLRGGNLVSSKIGSLYADADGIIKRTNVKPIFVTDAVSFSSAGWVTIAYNGNAVGATGGTRATGKFTIIEGASNRHQTVTFYASYHFGTGWNINVLNGGQYHGGSSIFSQIRILGNGTYNGAELQIYLKSTAVNVSVVLEENYQTDGWILMTPTQTPYISGLIEKARVDLIALPSTGGGIVYPIQSFTGFIAGTDWFRSQKTGLGWYNEAHATGIHALVNNEVRTYNNGSFRVGDSGKGYVTLHHDTALPGWIGFYNPNGTRNGYIGSYGLNNMTYVANLGTNRFLGRMTVNPLSGTTLHDNGITTLMLQSVNGSANAMTLGSATGTALGITGDTGLFGLWFGVNGSNGNTWIQGGRTDTATAYDVLLQGAGGKVGIGMVTSPNGKLGVYGGFIETDGTRLTDPTAGSGNGTHWALNYSPNNAYGIGMAALRDSKYDIWFQTGAINGGGYRWYIGTSEKMTMSSVGNVGIGTTSPAQKLHVAGTIRQTVITSSLLKANSSGDLVAAVSGTDYLSGSQAFKTINGVSVLGSGDFGLFRRSALGGVYDANTANDLIHTNYQWNNTPYGSIGSLSSVVYNNDWISQEFSSIEAKPSKWIRSRHSGTTWGNWYRMWHNGDFTATDIANWNAAYIKGNLATTNLIQTGDRSYNGGNKSLAFENLNYMSVYAEEGISLYANTGYVCIASSTGIKLSSESYDAVINTSALTGNISLYLPPKDGTLALTSDFGNGIYTPALIGTGTLSAKGFTYTRNGNVVTVAGRISVTGITSGTTYSVHIELPVSTAMPNDFDIVGVCNGVGGAVANVVIADAAKGKAKATFKATATSHEINVMFQYIIH